MRWVTLIRTFLDLKSLWAIAGFRPWPLLAPSSPGLMINGDDGMLDNHLSKYAPCRCASPLAMVRVILIKSCLKEMMCLSYKLLTILELFLIISINHHDKNLKSQDVVLEEVAKAAVLMETRHQPELNLIMMM